jgi:hypothetical protein
MADFDITTVIFRLLKRLKKNPNMKVINVCKHLRSRTLAQKTGKHSRGFRPLVIFSLWEVDASSSKGA